MARIDLKLKENPKLLQKSMADGRISLYLEYYLGRISEPILNKKGDPVLYTSGKMCGQPKYKIVHQRRKESLNLYLIAKPQTVLQRKRNSETIELAKQIRFEREKEFKENKFGYEFKKDHNYDLLTLYKDYLDKYAKKDVRVLRLSYNRFMDFLNSHYPKYSKSMQIECLTKEMVAEFVDYLKTRSKGEGAHTLYARFKKFVIWATEHDYFQKNPCHKVVCTIDKNTLRKDILSEEEMAMLAATHVERENKEVHRAFLFCLLTGVRYCDVKDLTFRNVDRSNRILKFEQEKTEGHSSASSLVLQLTDDTLELIGEPTDKTNPDELIFKLPSFSSCLRQVKNWVTKAEITKHISWHCSRHSFAVNLLNNGANIKTVSGLLGHSSLQHTEKYTRVVDKLKEEALHSFKHISLKESS